MESEIDFGFECRKHWSVEGVPQEKSEFFETFSGFRASKGEAGVSFAEDLLAAAIDRLVY